MDNKLIVLTKKENMQFHLAYAFICASWGVTANSHLSIKLFFVIISMIDYTQDFAGKTLVIGIDIVADILNMTAKGKNRIKIIDDALRYLVSQKINEDIAGTIIKDGTKNPVILNGGFALLEKYNIDINSGKIYITLHDTMRQIVLYLPGVSLSGYLQCPLNVILALPNQMIIHMYLLILTKAIYATKQNNAWTPRLDELYTVLCLPESYKNWREFRKNILDRLIKITNNNGCYKYQIKYKSICQETRYGEGRKSVVAVAITAKEKEQQKASEDSIPVPPNDDNTPAPENHLVTGDSSIPSEATERKNSEEKGVEENFIQILRDKGVNIKRIDAICQEYPIDYLEYLVAKKLNTIDYTSIGSPAGYIIRVIENEYLNYQHELEKEKLVAENKRKKEIEEMQKKEEQDRIKAEEDRQSAQYIEEADAMIAMMTMEQKQQLMDDVVQCNGIRGRVLASHTLDEAFCLACYRLAIAAAVHRYYMLDDGILCRRTIIRG